MSNNMWFLKSLCYNEAQHSNSSHDKISLLKQDFQHHLWHHMIGHLGHSTLHQVARDCDEFPKLMKHSLFKFSDCIKAEFNKHIKGNHKPKDNVLPSELCQMRCVFAWGTSNSNYNSASSNEYPPVFPLKTCRSYYNCCLLITDACARCSCVFPFSDKKTSCSDY